MKISNNGQTKFYILRAEDSTVDRPLFWHRNSGETTYNVSRAGTYTCEDLKTLDLSGAFVIPVEAMGKFQYLGYLGSPSNSGLMY